MAASLIAVSVVVGIAVSASACGAGHPVPVASSPTNLYLDQRTRAVGAVLDKFSAALRNGDAAAAQALLDSAASPIMRNHVAVQTHSIASLRPVTLSYRLEPTDQADVVIPPSLQSRLDDESANDAWVAPVVVDYALGGVDSVPESVSMPLVMVRHDDSWSILGDAASALGTGPERLMLWDEAGLTRTDTSVGGVRSIVIGYPGSAGLADRIVRQLPSAIGAVSRFWGSAWPRGAVVVATDNQRMFAGVAATGGADTAYAAAATVYDRLDGSVPVGQRVVFTPRAGDELPELSLDVVLRHELTHVATRSRTARDAPLWVSEGAAEYVGRLGTYRRPAEAAPDLFAQVRAGVLPADLPADTDFSVASAESSRLAYQSSWSAVAFIVDRYGVARFIQLYASMAAGPQTAEQQDVSIRAVTGRSRQDLIADWRGWLVRQAG